MPPSYMYGPMGLQPHGSLASPHGTLPQQHSGSSQHQPPAPLTAAQPPAGLAGPGAPALPPAQSQQPQQQPQGGSPSPGNSGDDGAGPSTSAVSTGTAAPAQPSHHLLQQLPRMGGGLRKSQSALELGAWRNGIFGPADGVDPVDEAEASLQGGTRVGLPAQSSPGRLDEWRGAGEGAGGRRDMVWRRRMAWRVRWQVAGAAAGGGGRAARRMPLARACTSPCR